MPNNFRRFLLILFVLFFLGGSSVIVFNSLGYQLNLGSDGIKFDNSSSFELDTSPRGAEVYFDDQTDSKFFTKFNATFASGTELRVNISKEHFESESFVLSTPTVKNSFTKIEDLHLLPLKFSVVSNIPDNYDTIQLLDTDKTIVKDGNYSIVTFNQSNTIVEEKLIYDGILPTNFRVIGQDLYVDQNNKLLLTKKQDLWVITDLEKYNFKSISKYNNEIIGLSEDNNLWMFDYNTNELEFIESNVSGIYKSDTVNKFWILKEGTIYGFEDLLNRDDFFLKSNILVENIDESNRDNFVIESSYQGFVILTGDKLYYYQEFNNQLSLISVNVEKIALSENYIHWIDDKALQSINLKYESKTNYNLSEKELNIVRNKNTKIDSNTWNRLNFYTSDGVYSIWFDSTFENQYVSQRDFKSWLKVDNQCLAELVDSFQLCLLDNQIVKYNNRKILDFIGL